MVIDSKWGEKIMINNIIQEDLETYIETGYLTLLKLNIEDIKDLKTIKLSDYNIKASTKVMIEDQREYTYHLITIKGLDYLLCYQKLGNDYFNGFIKAYVSCLDYRNFAIPEFNSDRDMYKALCDSDIYKIDHSLEYGLYELELDVLP